MNRKLKFIIIGIIGTIAFSSIIFFSLGVIRFDLGDNQKPNLTEAYNIDLIVDYKNGTIKERHDFTLDNEKTTAFHALEKWCKVGYVDFGIMGILITSIDGLTGDWLYSVNGTQPGVSAIKIYLRNNATVKWWRINV